MKHWVGGFNTACLSSNFSVVSLFISYRRKSYVSLMAICMVQIVGHLHEK